MREKGRKGKNAATHGAESENWTGSGENSSNGRRKSEANVRSTGETRAEKCATPSERPPQMDHKQSFKPYDWKGGASDDRGHDPAIAPPLISRLNSNLGTTYGGIGG